MSDRTDQLLEAILEELVAIRVALAADAAGPLPNSPATHPSTIPNVPHITLSPAPPLPGRCGRCGIHTDGLKGYVCADVQCPTGMARSNVKVGAKK